MKSSHHSPIMVDSTPKIITKSHLSSHHAWLYPQQSNHEILWLLVVSPLLLFISLLWLVMSLWLLVIIPIIVGYHPYYSWLSCVVPLIVGYIPTFEPPPQSHEMPTARGLTSVFGLGRWAQRVITAWTSARQAKARDVGILFRGGGITNHCDGGITNNNKEFRSTILGRIANNNGEK